MYCICGGYYIFLHVLAIDPKVIVYERPQHE